MGFDYLGRILIHTSRVTSGAATYFNSFMQSRKKIIGFLYPSTFIWL